MVLQVMCPPCVPTLLKPQDNAVTWDARKLLTKSCVLKRKVGLGPGHPAGQGEP